MKNKTHGFIVSLVMILAFTGNVYAASHFIRSGATGANNGNDWTNAWTNLPTTLVRGDTYYIADGTYASHTFNDNASGTNYIYLKKATVADHGTSTGWLDSYGDGQAIFPQLSFEPAPSGNGGYYDFNGYSAAATQNCGIKVSFGNGQMGINFWASGNHPYVKWQYIEAAGPGGAGDYPYLTTPDTQAIWINGNGAAGDTSHMLVSHCYIHGVATGMQDSNGNNYMTVEYSNFSDIRSSNSGNHDNIWWMGSSYGTFRFNKVYNFATEGIFLGGGAHTGVEIYGNVFYDGVGNARGVEFREADSGGPPPFTNIKIYNNTFVDLSTAAVRVMQNCSTSGVEIKNNIIVNSGGISLENGGNGVTQANNLTTTTSVFNNYTARDFHLAAATSPGSTLPAPYNTDLDGIIRGADGSWDIGAYEYVAGGGGLTPPAPPKNLRTR